MILLLLKNVLGDLHKYDDEYPMFVDDKTLENLSKAIASKDMEEAEKHFDKALVNSAIEIRRMLLSWYYEELSLTYYNLITDRDTISQYTGEAELNFYGQRCPMLSMTIKGREYAVAYSGNGNFLVTFNTGRPAQDEIIPFFHLLFIDRICLKIYIEYAGIIINGIKRLKEESEKNMAELTFTYEDTTIEELQSCQEALENSFDFLYRLITSYRNQLETENRFMKRKYELKYSKVVANELGGSIPVSVRVVSPLSLISESELLVSDLDKTRNDVLETKNMITSTIRDLIKAKKEANPTYYKKAWGGFQGFIENVIAKALSDQMDKIRKGK